MIATHEKQNKTAHKTAQIQSQIFVFLIAAVILIIIIIFGYRAITGLQENISDVEYTQLKTYLETQIDKVQSDYGTVVVRTIDVPTDFTHICFAQDDLNWNAGPGSQITDFTSTTQVSDNSELDYTIMLDSLRSSVKKNVFLYPNGVTSFYVGSICVKECRPEDRILCIETINGKAKIAIEGLGNRARIFEP